MFHKFQVLKVMRNSEYIIYKMYKPPLFSKPTQSIAFKIHYPGSYMLLISWYFFFSIWTLKAIKSLRIPLSWFIVWQWFTDRFHLQLLLQGFKILWGFAYLCFRAMSLPFENTIWLVFKMQNRWFFIKFQLPC